MSSAPARRIRRAARILLEDAQGRLLMFRFDPPDGQPFWCAPGGECDPDEDFPAAARRELREETGIDAEPGPTIATLSYDFITLLGEPVTADERFFRVRVAGGPIDTGGHTELERAVMREYGWFTRAELTTLTEPVYPDGIFDLIGPDNQQGPAR